jgi:hypothetical protein
VVKTETSPAPSKLASEYVGDIHTDFGGVHQVQTPAGMKLIFVAKSGTLSGPKIRGEVISGSNDWVTLGTDGIARLDVRGIIRLDDGDLATWMGQGIVNMTPETRTRMFSGEVISQAEMYARSTHSFQTASQKYSWLNGIVIVARMSLGPSHVDYEVHQLL